MNKLQKFVLVQLIFLVLLSPLVLAQSPWDPLRPASDFAKSIEAPVKIIVFLIAFALFVIAFKAWQKTKTERFMFIMLAFLFFVIKWALKLVDEFLSPGYFFADPSQNIMELLIFAALFAALFKK